MKILAAAAAVVSAFVLTMAACGPSTAELNAAKIATYHDPGSELFAIALETAAKTYTIADRDDEAATFMTEMQWYNPEGGRESAGAGNFVKLVDRSVQLGLVVSIIHAGGGQLMVVVTPKTFQHISGSPKPRELSPDDPNLPPWVQGRADGLQLEIHKNAKRLESP